MPITTSAKKALRQSKRKRVQNLRRLRTFRDVTKEVRELNAAGKKTEAQAALSKAYQALDKAAKTHVIKKNAASRKKSRLAKLLSAKS